MKIIIELDVNRIFILYALPTSYGDDSAQDIDLLAALGAVSARAGGPLLAAASSALVGCDQIEHWCVEVTQVMKP